MEKGRIKIDGYNFELFTGHGKRRGRKKELTPLDREIIIHLKKSGVPDAKIAHLTKLNLSTSYINQKFRQKNEN